MEDFGISLKIQITDYSDLNKLLSVTAHVLMIVDRLKRRIEPPCHVGPSYLNKAEYLWLRDVQGELVTRGDFSSLQSKLDLFCDDVVVED